jgi:hypothetical protein
VGAAEWVWLARQRRSEADIGERRHAAR